MKTYTRGEVEIDRVHTEVFSFASFLGPVAIVAMAVGMKVVIFVIIPPALFWWSSTTHCEKLAGLQLSYQDPGAAWLGLVRP